MTIDNSGVGANADPNSDEYQMVTGDVPLESIELFIEKLNDDWEYPVDTHLGDTPPVIDAETHTTEEEEDEDVDEEVTDTTPDPNTTPDTSAEPETVKVNGHDVPLADVQRLYEFDQYLRNNPEASQRVAKAINPEPDGEPAPTAGPSGEPAVSPQATTPTPLEPPEFLDFDDPAQKFLWESFQLQQSQIHSLTTATEKQQKSLADRQAVIDTDVAVSAFRTAHPNFNDEQMGKLRQHAAQMGILDSLLTTSPNPVAALSRTLDLAALDHEESRALYMAPPETPREKTATQKSQTRKDKLSALSGSSGSVPRQTATPKPQSDREMIAEFAKQLGDQFQQS